MRCKKSFVVLVSLAGFGWALTSPGASAQRSNDYEWFDPIIVVRRYLLDGFFEAPDEEAMQQAMINSMIGTLDDPYTVFVPPSNEAEFDKELRGTYVGIGAEVSVLDDFLTIISPLDDSPALAAGVRAGDIVLAIEGESTVDRPIDECIGLLLGEAGTPVTIRVRHIDGTEEDLTMDRRQIITPTTKGVRRHGEAWDWWLDADQGIGYVRLTQFNDSTVPGLRDALGRMQRSGLHALVLDLRGNPGGELGAAIEIADLFLREGMIVSVQSRHRTGQTWYAKDEGTLPDFPMIVLVNRDSASASEIVAGALQENGRAKVLGTRTFGKGSVQELHELPADQGTLKMTTGHYSLRSGRTIARKGDALVWGVDPDEGMVLGMSDRAYLEMYTARRQFEIIGGDAPQEADFADPDWIRETLKDEQLAAALTALSARLRGDAWPTFGTEDATQVAIEQRIRSQTRYRLRLIEELDDVERQLATLHDLAEEAGRAPLLPPGTDLSDGTLTIRDKDGNLIGAFRLGDNDDLEPMLRHANLIPLDADEG